MANPDANIFNLFLSVLYKLPNKYKTREPKRVIPRLNLVSQPNPVSTPRNKADNLGEFFTQLSKDKIIKNITTI